ncbi:MAG: hypothetical protein S4CHLAM6_03080 [Chlamydiae bacterium]|nr:hypothetical protein [Chlamydiota bacterium]
MVAKLIAIDGPEKGLELILEKGTTWIIGRDPKDCDFVLDDPKASRQHAKIWQKDGKYWIKNLSRTNPVLVEDEPLKDDQQLGNNQTLKLGESHFRFTEVKASSSKSSSDYDQLFEDLDEPPISIDLDEDESHPRDKEKEDGNYYDTIFQDVGDDDTYGDLSESYVASERFILKVLTGPNSGAEFAMQKGRSYIIGTDVTGCDIIFNDLSVSRHHARISITEEDEIIIEDLDSRNGVVIDDEQIKGQKFITPKNMTTLGTTTFIVVDREAGEETVVTKIPQLEEEQVEEEIEDEVVEEVLETKKSLLKGFVTESTFVFTGVLIAAILILGTGAMLLFKTSPVEKYNKDYTRTISNALGDEFPDIRFTYNTNNGEIFVVGHVLSSTQQEELMYKLDNLAYITNIKNDVVVDEYVNQEMNLILTRNGNWQGISVHSPKAGQFVLSGYLPTREDNAELTDYMNIQFPYIERLNNYVVVEQDLFQEIASKLYNYGFYNVNIELSNGEVSLGGYINHKYEKAYHKASGDISKIMGVRKINNFVVLVTPKSGGALKTAEHKFHSLLHDPSIVNLTNYLGLREPPTLKYTVTGFAKQESKVKAVEVDGKILLPGDKLDGMKVIAFEGNFVFLEKNGLKYKIECIKCD